MTRSLHTSIIINRNRTSTRTQYLDELSTWWIGIFVYKTPTSPTFKSLLREAYRSYFNLIADSFFYSENAFKFCSGSSTNKEYQKPNTVSLKASTAWLQKWFSLYPKEPTNQPHYYLFKGARLIKHDIQS